MAKPSNDYEAAVCAIVSLVSVILLVVSGAALVFDLGSVPVIGPVIGGLRWLVKEALWIVLWTLMYGTYLYPVAGLANGYYAQRLDPDKSVCLMWIAVLMMFANYFVHIHKSYGDISLALDDPFQFFATIFAHCGFLAACIFAGLIIRNGVECARKAGWIE